MDFAKDEIFSIRYESENYNKEKRLSNFFSEHRIILILSIIGLAVGTINCVLIYNFVKVLTSGLI